MRPRSLLWAVLAVIAGASYLLLHNPFRVLGVHSSASSAEIKRAFRRLSLVYHPDKNAGSPSSEAMFLRVNKAYSELSNDETREGFRRYGSFYSIFDRLKNRDLPDWFLRGLQKFVEFAAGHTKEIATTLVCIFFGSVALVIYRIVRAVQRRFPFLIGRVFRLVVLSFVIHIFYTAYTKRDDARRKSPSPEEVLAAKFRSFSHSNSFPTRGPREFYGEQARRSSRQHARGSGSAKDKGPWPCTEAGCPAPFVSCADLKGWCGYRFRDAWDESPPEREKDDFIAAHCPATCFRS